MVVDQEFALFISKMILAVIPFIVAIFKYREILEFIYKSIVLLGKPVMCVVRWVKLARKLEKDMAANKGDIAWGRKEIDDVRKSIVELTDFVKNKLSPNGGSSIPDSIKRIENRQLSYENRQLALLNDSKNGFFSCSIDGKNTWVNRTYARFLGCGTTELLGLGWRKFIRTEELARYGKIWETAFRDGCEFDDRVEFIDVHGHQISLYISVSAVQNDKGETTSYIGQVTAL